MATAFIKSNRHPAIFQLASLYRPPLIICIKNVLDLASLVMARRDREKMILDMKFQFVSDDESQGRLWAQ